MMSIFVSYPSVRLSQPHTHTIAWRVHILCILAFVHARARPHIMEHFTVFHSLHCRRFDDNDKATMRFDRAAPSPNEVTRKIHRRVFSPVPKTVEVKCDESEKKSESNARALRWSGKSCCDSSYLLGFSNCHRRNGTRKNEKKRHINILKQVLALPRLIVDSSRHTRSQCETDQQQQWNQIIRATQIC